MPLSLLQGAHTFGCNGGNGQRGSGAVMSMVIATPGQGTRAKGYRSEGQRARTMQAALRWLFRPGDPSSPPCTLTFVAPPSPSPPWSSLSRQWMRTTPVQHALPVLVPGSISLSPSRSASRRQCVASLPERSQTAEGRTKEIQSSLSGSGCRRSTKAFSHHLPLSRRCSSTSRTDRYLPSSVSQHLSSSSA